MQFAHAGHHCMHGWMQVADANSAVRLHLCMKYFSTLRQLDSEDLSDADKASLQQQLHYILLATQSRSVVPRCSTCRQPICPGFDEIRTVSRKSVMHNYAECCLACWHMLLPESSCKYTVFGAVPVNDNNATSSCRLLGLNEPP